MNQADAKPLATAFTFEEAALLDALGFEFASAAKVGNRVRVFFDDPTGEGARQLGEHKTTGVQVNSRDFERGLAFAKRVIFTTRDGR